MDLKFNAALFYNTSSPPQMFSCMPSVTMSCPPCWSVLFSCCSLVDVRSVAGGQSPSSPSPSWQWPYYLFFTAYSCLSVMVKQVGSMVTLLSSWLCLQRSAVRWHRGGCSGVCLSGFSPGFFYWLVYCCYQGHLLCFTSAQYALDTTVSFPVCTLMHL